MGWKRIHDRLYYYRSRRVGCRVETEYVGGGEIGAMFAEIDAIDRTEAAEEREVRREEREAAEQEERRWAEWFRSGDLLTDAVMLAAGFRRHRGQWRRRRHGSAEECGGRSSRERGTGQADDVG